MTIWLWRLKIDVCLRPAHLRPRGGVVMSRPAMPNTEPARFRKKPIEIEAMQWTGDYDALDRLLGLNWGRADAKDVSWEHEDSEEVVVWNSAEKLWLPVPIDHWIIRGVQGEFYPCKPDIFEATYEAVS